MKGTANKVLYLWHHVETKPRVDKLSEGGVFFSANPQGSVLTTKGLFRNLLPKSRGAFYRESLLVLKQEQNKCASKPCICHPSKRLTRYEEAAATADLK